MKKKIELFIIIVVFLIIQLSNCSAPAEVEKEKKAVIFSNKRLGGVSNDISRTIKIDHNGNIIVAGEISINADLNGDGDKIDGPELLDSIYYGGFDIFISKFNSSGVFLWAKRLGGMKDDICHKIAFDTAGSIIVVGVVVEIADLNGDGNIDMDLGDYEVVSGSAGRQDIFITKFNSLGVFQWSKRIISGLESNGAAYSVTTDNDNNVIITGVAGNIADLNGDYDFDPTGGESDYYGGNDIFISKFNASGSFLWSKRLGGTSVDTALGVACDQAGNIIITGSVIGSADLNGDADSTDGAVESSSYGNSDIFISKFEPDGDFLWAKRKGGASGDTAYAVDTDSDDNIYITGKIIDTVDLNDDGLISLNTAENTGTVFGDDDAFIIKMNSAGNYAGSKRIGGILKDHGRSLTVDNNNNVIISMEGKGSIYFRGTELSPSLISSPAAIHGDYDGIIIKLSQSLSFTWCKRLGGIGTDYCLDTAADNSRNIFTTGTVMGNVDLNGDLDTDDGRMESGSGLGNLDIFISKFGE